MSKAGQNNYKGINSQAWAAMSLFLQHFRDSHFSYIKLESPEFEDFDLVFNEGKKIICESKDRKEPFNYSHLKEILSKLENSELSDDDQILIICANVNEELVSDVEHARHWEPIRKKFEKKGYTVKMLEMLPRVKFWHIKTNLTQQTVYALFADLLSFWLPEEDIKRIADSILIDKIYAGSASGATYSRIDLRKEVDSLALEARQNSVYYNESLSKREEQFWELEKALSNSSHGTWQVPKELSAFSADFERLKFAKDRLAGKHNGLVLRNWDPVWKLNRLYVFSFGIFDIFEHNLHTEDNRDYVLSYIKKSTKSLRGFYRSDYFEVNVAKIVSKIIDADGNLKYLKEGFSIVKDLIAFNEKDFFYVATSDRGHNQWEKEQICDLLSKIFNHSKADSKLRNEIFGLITTTFNITEDDGEFDWHVPKQVYGIVRAWLFEDFNKRFDSLVKIISDQYDLYYGKLSKKIGFKGWEHIGGGTSFWGSNYHVGDRHFISGILQPAIRDFYDKDKKKGWSFIVDKCISPVSKVSKSRPDFLNRAVIGIVLERYSNEDKEISREAFKILAEFVLSRRGIPHKSDLIYQAVASSSLSDEKKLAIVSLTVKKYKIPVNPFVEQIVTGLAQKGYPDAISTLKTWFTSPEYFNRFHFEEDSASSIRKLLGTNLDLAIELYKSLITSVKVKGKSDRFSAYTVAVLLYDILKIDYEKGIDIIRLLESQRNLSDNQQIIYAFSLFQYQAKDDSDDLVLLLKVYADVIDPFLTKYHNSAIEISERLTAAHCRDAMVQFAARLAVKKEMEKAMRIVRVFVEDPDPYLPGQDPHDPKDEYNEYVRILEGKEPSAITSVRGWCGWTLMKCSVLEGRAYIPEIIQLTRKLMEDENYYVVHMGGFALTNLARNRLTVMPDDRETLFFNDDKKVALTMAKEVENIAFEFLDRFESWPEKVQNAMAETVLHVFEPLRALNEEDSLRFVSAVSRLPLKAIQEAAPLLIYFAELRKDNYKKWKFSIPGLYDDLGPGKYDSKKFKELVLGIIKKIQSENPDDCFRFCAAVRQLVEGTIDAGNIDSYTKIALEYFDLLTDSYAHNIYNTVYMIVQDKFRTPDKYAERWLNLLFKCLRIEAEFYKAQKDAGKLSEVYWYPSLYHPQILELIGEKFGDEQFMEMAEIYFGFPKEMELNESDALVSKIQKIAKSDKRAAAIITSLIERNPSKYWSLNKPHKSK